jgi:6,7-dimethyl-8-ribityllumazine synthase
MQHTQPELALSTDPKPWRIGIIGTEYHKSSIDAMIDGAKEVLMQHGIDAKNITVQYAYGSWEVPLLGIHLAENNQVDALMGFGIIIQGDTYHDQHLARETSRAMMDIQLQYGIPFGYEILHIKSAEHLPSRTSGDGNKGKEAAFAILHSLQNITAISLLEQK